LKRSNFNFLKENQIINLEKSISYGQNISGHFTQGHVDTIARVKKIIVIDKTWIVNLQIIDKELGKFLIEKASISINGVSLTISKVSKNFFDVSIIPHTLKLTNLKKLKRNSLVNVELDIFSKYMYKYLN
jgi:riboflavin synthase